MNNTLWRLLKAVAVGAAAMLAVFVTIVIMCFGAAYGIPV